MSLSTVLIVIELSSNRQGGENLSGDGEINDVFREEPVLFIQTCLHSTFNAAAL